MAKPIAGDRVVNAADPITINHIAFTIRLMESGDNYTQLNKTASASGAYQIINSTWKSWSAGSGVANATTYPRAYQAPPDVQDAVAKWKIMGILAAYGDHLAAVPVIWYYPAAWGNDALLDAVPAGNSLTVRDYAERWIKKYDSVGGSGGTYGTAAGQVVPDQSVPGGIGTQVLDALTSPFAGLTSIVEVVKKAFEILFSAGTWIRVLQVIGGMVAIGMGIHLIATGNVVPKVPKGLIAAAGA